MSIQPSAGLQVGLGHQGLEAKNPLSANLLEGLEVDLHPASLLAESPRQETEARASPSVNLHVMEWTDLAELVKEMLPRLAPAIVRWRNWVGPFRTNLAEEVQILVLASRPTVRTVVLTHQASAEMLRRPDRQMYLTPLLEAEEYS